MVLLISVLRYEQQKSKRRAAQHAEAETVIPVHTVMIQYFPDDLDSVVRMQ
jgi:hypothetical protein